MVVRSRGWTSALGRNLPSDICALPRVQINPKFLRVIPLRNIQRLVIRIGTLSCIGHLASYDCSLQVSVATRAEGATKRVSLINAVSPTHRRETANLRVANGEGASVPRLLVLSGGTVADSPGATNGG